MHSLSLSPVDALPVAHALKVLVRHLDQVLPAGMRRWGEG
jgi:hypothetical protein